MDSGTLGNWDLYKMSTYWIYEIMESLTGDCKKTDNQVREEENLYVCCHLGDKHCMSCLKDDSSAMLHVGCPIM